MVLGRHFPIGYNGRSEFYFATKVHSVELGAIIPFIAWGTQAPAQGTWNRDFWGMNLSLERVVREPGRFQLQVEFPAFEPTNRSIRFDRFVYHYDGPSAFPSRYTRGLQTRYLTATFVAPGTDPIPWTPISPVPGAGCVQGLPIVTKYPAGSQGISPFHFAAALQTAQQSSDWQAYVQSRPDWMVTRAVFSTEGFTSANLRYVWSIVLGHPDRIDADGNSYRVFRVAKLAGGGQHDPYLDSVRNGGGDPYPSIENGGLRLEDLSRVYERAVSAHPNARVDLVYHVGKAFPAARIPAAVVSAVTWDRSDIPLETVWGESACLLEIGRNQPVEF